MAGVTRQAIGKACQGALTGAAVGSKLDLDHESVRLYLADHGVPVTVLRVGDGEPDIAELLDWTLRDITDRFAGIDGFKDYVQARRQLGAAKKLELSNQREMRQLISRQYVTTHVFGYLDAGNRRLLGDMPKTIARRLYALAGSGADIEEAETVVREHISSQLKTTKGQVRANLRKAGPPTQSDGAGRSLSSSD